MLKGGEFIITKTTQDQVFIPEEWSEEQLMIRDMVKDFCDQEILQPMRKSGRELDASIDRDAIIELLNKAAALGLCGLSIAEEYGGMDLDFNTGLLFGEAISNGFSFATTIGAQTSIGSLPIVYYGTAAQKEKYLPKIGTAEYKACYALTEPSAGSDANSGKTKATLTSDGNTYLLNGQKMWITNGGFADIFIVFAKIEDDKNLSAFIVEKAFGGITLGEEEKKLGIKEYLSNNERFSSKMHEDDDLNTNNSFSGFIKESAMFLQIDNKTNKQLNHNFGRDKRSKWIMCFIFIFPWCYFHCGCFDLVF